MGSARNKVVPRNPHKAIQYPSEAISYLFNISKRPVSLLGHKPWIYFHESTARKTVCRTARQVAKSTNAAIKILTKSITIPRFNTMYLAPLSLQTKVFSYKRLGTLMLDSPVIKQYTDNSCVDQILQKTFTTGSSVALSYYRDDPSRARGDSLDYIIFDEVQDMSLNGMGVILDGQSASEYQEQLYIGTAKNTDNTIEYFWERSDKCEWVVKCTHCNAWNILGRKNIGLTGLICAKCGKGIENRNGQLVATGPKDAEYRGIHISQLGIDHLIKGTLHDGTSKWKVILEKLESKDDVEFDNEILGLPNGLGLTEVTREELRGFCGHHSILDVRENPDRFIQDYNYIITGIDYSGGGSTLSTSGQLLEGTSLHAYVTIGLARNRSVHILDYDVRGGRERDAIPALAAQILRLNPLVLIGDVGGSTGNQNMLKQLLPGKHIMDFMYRGVQTSNVNNANVCIGARTPLIDYVMDLLKRGCIRLPKAESSETLIDHILAEYRDEMMVDGIKKHTWARSPEKPDDLLHALVMAIYALHRCFHDPHVQHRDYLQPYSS